MTSTILHIRPFRGIAFAAAAIFTLGGATVASAQPQQMPGPAGPAPSGSNPEVMQELSEIREEMNGLQQRIQEIQQAAMAESGVVEKQAVYEESLEESLVEQDPNVKKKLDKRNALLEELRKHPEVVNPNQGQSPEVQARIQEFRGLEQEIAPLRQAANADPAVKEKRTELETVLIEEMSNIDPETPRLLDQRMKLAQRFQQLQQQRGM